MKNISLLIGCLLVMFSFACEEPEAEQEEEETTEEIEEALEDEPEDEDAIDLAALVEVQEQRCQELFCDRPHQCWEESDEHEGTPDHTIEECYEGCGVPAELMGELEATEEVLGCIEADDRAANCLDELECDELLAFVQPDVESDHICTEEVAAVDEACAFLDELFLEQMDQDMPAEEE